MKYCKRIVIHLLILTALLCFITTLLENMQQTAKIANLLKGEDTKELLRRQQVPAELYEDMITYEEESDFSRYDYLLAHVLTEKTEKKELDAYLKLLYQYHPQNIRNMERVETAVWGDLSYFPIPLPQLENGMSTSFENSPAVFLCNQIQHRLIVRISHRTDTIFRLIEHEILILLIAKLCSLKPNPVFSRNYFLFRAFGQKIIDRHLFSAYVLLYLRARSHPQISKIFIQSQLHICSSLPLCKISVLIIQSLLFEPF